MISVEMVADAEGRTPPTEVALWLNAALPRFVRRKHGVLLGIRNSAIIITPPLVVTAEEVTTICNALTDAFARINFESCRSPESG